MRAQVESLLMWREDECREGPLASARWWLKGVAVRAHPHLRVRYYPVLRHLKEIGADGETRVLEVGAGSLGITRYWHHPVTGVDIDFKGPQLGYLRQVEASAEQLPFVDDSFDVVISVDMLEHLTPDQRSAAIREMMRVSAGEVILGIPCGDDARTCERWARTLCSRAVSSAPDIVRADRIRRRSAFLAEHATCGLPADEDIVALMKRFEDGSGRRIDVETFGNEPTWFWRLSLPAVVPLGRLSAALSHAAGLVLQPLLPLLPGRPYRRFFLARKQQPDSAGS